MNITKEEISREVKKHYKEGNLVFKNLDGTKDYIYESNKSGQNIVESTTEFICKCLNI